MNHNLTTLERAFALASSGKFSTVSAIKRQLKAEQFDPRQLESPTLCRQLRELCVASQKPATR
jgi:hypothetical protein